VIAVVLALQLLAQLLDVVRVAWGFATGPTVGLMLLIVAAKALTIEALWTVRPWATRAFATLAVLVVARMAVGTGLALGGAGLWPVLFYAIVLVLIASYVRDRTRAIHHGAAAPVPVPRPRP
jgi:hypothetical protein